MKYDIKTFELCGSKTGYLWSFIVYIGKDTEVHSSLTMGDVNKTAKIVLNLSQPLLGQGRTLWMDNYYNSPILARILKINYHTDCRMKEKKLKKGEVFGEYSGPISVLKWSDKKIVPMISTYIPWCRNEN
ncbi:hypothetical protein J437_LFUL016566 [Ladona fulva]|uniref:PiggyBac transposable element-derived protein domain-containing protein n=1 Tax=Ladona fulva TaxID=123851 RepID=A0A8K0PA27_LADFU|nr:hypothetical protein J437_LFUL016566 [Ladona fulva]